MFETEIVEKMKTHILCSLTFFPRKLCRLWDNVKKYCRAGQATDGSIIRRMRIDCWITKATNRHSEYVILVAFPRQKWFRERAAMLHIYVLCLSCLLQLHLVASDAELVPSFGRKPCNVPTFRRKFFRLQRRKVDRGVKVGCILKMEAAFSFESLARVYRTVPRHILFVFISFNPSAYEFEKVCCDSPN
jgi:hypothetical protein